MAVLVVQFVLPKLKDGTPGLGMPVSVSVLFGHVRVLVVASVLFVKS